MYDWSVFGICRTWRIHRWGSRHFPDADRLSRCTPKCVGFGKCASAAFSIRRTSDISKIPDPVVLAYPTLPTKGPEQTNRLCEIRLQSSRRNPLGANKMRRVYANLNPSPTFSTILVPTRLVSANENPTAMSNRMPTWAE